MEKIIELKAKFDDLLQGLEQANKRMNDLDKSAERVSNTSQQGNKTLLQQTKTIEDQNAKIQQRLKEEMQDLAELKRRRDTAFNPATVREYDKRVQETGQRIKALGGNFEELKSVAVMNLKEMQKELRALREQKFDNMSESEVNAIKGRMGELTDGISKFRKEINMTSRDNIPALIGGFQALISSTQIVIGGLNLMGVENKKLQQATVQLISVSQALSQLYVFMEGQGIRRTALAIKDIALKGKQIAVTVGLAVASKVATVAQLLWTKSILAFSTAVYNIPVLGWLLAIIGAIIGVVIALTKYWDKLTAVFKSSNKYMEGQIKVMGEVAKAVRKKHEAWEKAHEEEMKGMEREIELAKAQGKTQEEIFEMEAELHRKRIKQQKDRIKLLEIGAKLEGWAGEEFKKRIAEQIKALDDLEHKQEVHFEKEKTRIREQNKKLAEENQKRIDKDIKDEKKRIEALAKMNADAQKQLEDLIIENIKDEQERQTEALQLKQKRERENFELIYSEAENYAELLKQLETKQENERTALTTAQGKLRIEEEKKLQEMKLNNLKDGEAKKLALLENKFENEKILLIEKYGEETELIKELEIAKEQAIDDIRKKYMDKAKEERLKEIQEIANNTSQVAGLYGDMFSNIANSAEEGSERQKRARKATVTADLIASTASTIGAIAEGVAKAQILLPPLNIIEGIRIAGLGALQLSRIAQARSEIAKMKYGGHGVFQGKSHTEGGIRFGNVEVEGGEPFWVMPKNAPKERVQIMNKVFQDLQSGKMREKSNVYAPVINVNDEYQKKIYETLQNSSDNGQNYKEIKQGNFTRRIYN
jgi:hypothetical protein